MHPPPKPGARPSARPERSGPPTGAPAFIALLSERIRQTPSPEITPCAFSFLNSSVYSPIT
jgi:hypothetical protein